MMRPALLRALAVVMPALASPWSPAAASSRDPSDPVLLFHASFDKAIDTADTAAGSPDFVPQLYDRSALLQAQSLQDWQRHKDYRAYRAALHKEGRFGPCLSCPIGKAHRFRALGNVNIRRGTLSFWIHFGRKLSTAHAPLVSVTGGGLSLRVRYKTLQCSVGGQSHGLKEVAWRPNQWYHVALVYDCRQGFKYYVDGKELRMSRWGRPEYGWHTDSYFADLLTLAGDKYRGSAMPLMLDEVAVYSRPMAAEEIAKLAQGKPLSRTPKTEPAPASTLLEQHRLAELGWDAPGDYLRVGPEPVHVRKIGVHAARDVKCWRMGAVDGVPGTRWPTGYQGYAIPNGGLHLALDEDASIDYVKLRGDFDGRAYAGAGVAEPPAERALMAVKSEGKFVRRLLDSPVRAATLSFFARPRTRSEKMDSLGRRFWSNTTRIFELGLFQVRGERGAIAQATAASYAISGQPFEPRDKWVKWALVSHDEPADRVALALSPGAGRDVTLPGLRHAHLFIPPRDAATPMAGLRLRLTCRPFAEPTRLRVEVRDPVDITRTMLDLDFELRAASADVTLDLQDFVIPAGLPLWITLTPEHALTLAAESRVDLLTRPMDEVRIEHVRNMLNYAKDRFIHVSEPRPWSKVPVEECGERLLAFRQLSLPLLDLKRNAPESPRLRSLWTWTHPRENPDASWLETPAEPGAPRWAVHAKESMKLYRRFVLWWIENRQIPNGLFGSNYGDDTDLVNDWLSLGMICDPDGRIRDSVRRIADYCWREAILRGINRRHTDTLHAYEEGVNTQPILALLHYGDPVYIERLMETSRTVRDELTYERPGGRRFFKSCWYGATHIDTEFQRGTDHTGNALMLHPTLYLAYYSRNPGAVKLLHEWAGAWCDIQTEAWQKGGPRGPFPTRVQYPTGEVVGTATKYLSGYGYHDVCLAMYTITGEEKYATPMRTWVENGSFPPRVPEDWIAARDPSSYKPRVIEAADGVDWGPLKPLMGDDRRTIYAYMAWQLTGKRRYVETALEHNYKRIAVLFPMHTWAEQSADRVAVSKTLVDRLYLGGTPGYRNKLWPTHTVSWSGFGEEFAAWVLHTTRDSLRVWIYSFEPQPQQGELRVWGLDRGEYDVCFGTDANEDEAIDTETWRKKLSLSRNTPIPLTLPPRQLVVLEAKQMRRGPSIYELPDLAVAATDMALDPKTRKLTFVVHNVGNAAVRDVEVVVRIDGTRAPALRIAAIEAPVDLEPRTASLTVDVPPGAASVAVELDPANRIAEVWEGNNRAEFSMR